jgi:hypothetical protein
MQQNRLNQVQGDINPVTEPEPPTADDVYDWCQALEACEWRFEELGVESEALMRDVLTSLACGNCVYIDRATGIVREISQ